MPGPLDTIHASIRDLREMVAEFESALVDLDNEVSGLARRMPVGVGMTDKAATIQGGDLDTGDDGFAIMRPDDDADPETGAHP